MASKITGLKELGEAMRSLTEDVNKRICRRATARGAAFVRDLAKIRAPVDDPAETPDVPFERLKKAIAVARVPPSKSRLTSEHLVVVLGGPKHNDASHIGALQEFGTVKQAPRSFMRTAFDTGKRTAADIIIDETAKGIAKAAERANRGNK